MRLWLLVSCLPVLLAVLVHEPSGAPPPACSGELCIDHEEGLADCTAIEYTSAAGAVCNNTPAISGNFDGRFANGNSAQVAAGWSCNPSTDGDCDIVFDWSVVSDTNVLGFKPTHYYSDGTNFYWFSYNAGNNRLRAQCGDGSTTDFYSLGAGPTFDFLVCFRITTISCEIFLDPPGGTPCTGASFTPTGPTGTGGTSLTLTSVFFGEAESDFKLDDIVLP